MILKRHLVICLFLAILSSIVNMALAEGELCNVTPAQVTQEVVKMVAEQGESILRTTNSSVQHYYEQLPLNTFELGEGLRLATPLAEYSITSKSLENYAKQHLFESVLTPVSSWYIQIFLTTRNYAYATHVFCWQGHFSLDSLRYGLSENILKLMGTEMDFTQAKLINYFRNSELGYSSIAITNNAETILYPVGNSDRYDNINPVDSLGGYNVSDIITEMLLDYLTTMNRRGNATISPDLKIHVPHAIFYYPTPEDIPTSLDLDFTFVPNPENHLLFEGSYTYSVD